MRRVEFEHLGRLYRAHAKQVPFAASLALNKTVERARVVAQKETLPDALTLRNGWTQGGIRYTRSTKRSLSASVGSIDWYSERQETGADMSAAEVGAQRAQDSRVKGAKVRKRLLVINKAMRTGSGRVRKVSGGARFTVSSKGRLVALVRQGKRVRPVGVLKESLSFGKKTNLEKAMTEFARHEFPAEFRRAMTQAIATG